ncbi:MAG: hypothetical protein DMD43_08570 [Gemmatimonadetes bacterium]|nr:MAG: hypothetical protein DMD43_08570 [Gemmatimonadota bacterium]
MRCATAPDARASIVKHARRCGDRRSEAPMRALAIATLALQVAFGAQAQIPDTPAGRQLAGWLAAFNNPDHQALRHFLEVNAPDRLAQIDRAFGFRAQTGGFEFRKVDESAPTRLAVLAQERASDQFARIEIRVDSTEPHRIISLSISGAPRPAELGIPRLSEAALLADLRSKLDQDAAADRFAGAVLVAKDGKPVFDTAYGLADRERRTPNTLNTRFRLGSMNKMFTAVSVLQLVQAGKLTLDAPLATYLPDYPNKDAASRSSARSTPPIAWSSAASRTTSRASAPATLRLPPAASGSTATTVSSCLAPSSKGSAARPTTTTSRPTCTRRRGCPPPARIPKTRSWPIEPSATRERRAPAAGNPTRRRCRIGARRRVVATRPWETFCGSRRRSASTSC